jgi:hypothetical protein
MKLRLMAPGMGWIFAFLAGANFAAAAESALSALSALPAKARANLSRIEGPQGNPRPDRWYFDVYEADSEGGLREYVVAEHQIVARREVSQFASDLTAEDVLDGRFLRIDSTAIEKLAGDYASANSQVIASLSLTLAKPFREARPVWIARCFDSYGVEFGRLVVAAENGTVFTHQGFSREPSRFLPPIATGPTGGKTEQARVHLRRPPPPHLPIEQGPQHSLVDARSKRVPPTPEESRLNPAPARRPWWSYFAH